jgi:hypothetical protein
MPERTAGLSEAQGFMVLIRNSAHALINGVVLIPLSEHVWMLSVQQANRSFRRRNYVLHPQIAEYAMVVLASVFTGKQAEEKEHVANPDAHSREM